MPFAWSHIKVSTPAIVPTQQEDVQEATIPELKNVSLKVETSLEIGK
jgi:hypothetical protein